MEAIQSWLPTSWAAVGLVLLSVAVIYPWIIALTRVGGLRSFSKMSAFDVSMTLAIGTLFGSTVVSSNPPLLQAAVALAALFGAQSLIAWARRSGRVRGLVDNSPILLMDGKEMLHENLRRARIQESDLIAVLRQANVERLENVKAVILETTGDISVLHGEGGTGRLDRRLLSGVRGRDGTMLGSSREHPQGAAREG